MRIGLIGCGRVGVTIFLLLKKNNTIVGVHDKKKERQRAAARLLGIRRNPPYRELVAKSEAVFIATPDDEILKAYARLRGHVSGPKSIFHFSGLLPADIIPAKRDIGRASIHPFATFPKIAVPTGKKRYRLSIEGDARALKVCRAVFDTGHFTLRKIRKQDKALYHLVGVFSSNLLVALVAAASSIAGRIGWTEKEVGEMIFPIIEDTVSNMKTHGIERALSGPLQRGDASVIRKHLAALRGDKHLRDVYRSLSRVMLGRMNRRGTEELKKILR